MKSIKVNGFTLMEIICTLAIIAIIASIAYPSYTDSIIKMKRLEAKTTLLEIQNQYERFFILHNSYEHATIGTSNGAIYRKSTTNDGNYNLEITEQKENYYLLTATPISAIAKQDSECGSFTLSSLGERGISGSGLPYHCWHH